MEALLRNRNPTGPCNNAGDHVIAIHQVWALTRVHACPFGAVSRKRRPSLANQPLLVENFAYAMRAGTVNSASVPAPGSLQIFKRPPIFLARSCMPGIPQWPRRAPSFRTLES